MANKSDSEKKKETKAAAKTGSGSKKSSGTQKRKAAAPRSKAAVKNQPKASDTQVSMEQKEKFGRQVSREKTISRIILAIILIALGAFLIVSIYTSYAGQIGHAISFAVRGLFGLMGYILPFYFLLFSLLLIINRAGELGKLPTVLLLIAFYILASATYSIDHLDISRIDFGLDWLKQVFLSGVEGKGGGLLGMTTAYVLMKLIGVAGAYIATIACMLICALITLNKPMEWMLARLKGFGANRKAIRAEIKEEKQQMKAEKKMRRSAMTAELHKAPLKESVDPYYGEVAENGSQSLENRDVKGTSGSPDEKANHEFPAAAGIIAGQAAEEANELFDASDEAAPLPNVDAGFWDMGEDSSSETRIEEKKKDPSKWKKFKKFFNDTQNESDSIREQEKERRRQEEEIQKNTSMDEDAISYGTDLSGIYGSLVAAEPVQKGPGLGVLGLDEDPFGEVNYGGNKNYTSGDAYPVDELYEASSDGAGIAGNVDNYTSSVDAIYDGANNSAQSKQPASAEMAADKQAESAAKNPGSGESLAGTSPIAAAAAGLAGQKHTAEDGADLEDSLSRAKAASVRVPGSDDVPYELPPLSLLNGSGGIVSANQDESLRKRGMLLEETLHSFNVDARVINVEQGPSVTRFEVQPGAGVPVRKIVGLEHDIALNMRAKNIRIEAPIPGKAAVGIEIENDKKTPVYLREVIASKQFQSSSSRITFAVGRDISGNPVVANLKDMPHLLIAGSTGSGKSVCINSIIMSILYKARPDEVKLIMVDPKVVELGNYNGIPHLMIPVVNQPSKAAIALNWAVREMEDRYNRFSEIGVKDLEGYNNKAKKNPELEFMPQIVIIIDELADLMMAAPQQVEDAICRLAQMARAAGMHLIVATQRPSVDVITGVIKANMPSRIAFAVSSSIDSRTILDKAGAEKLLGKGDMLFNPLSETKPMRVQGTFVTEDETQAVIDFVSGQFGHEAKFSDDLMDTIKTGDFAAGDEEVDELLPQAIEHVITMEQASSSMLQRKFRVGYNRAARMIDMMEERGIITPADGSRPRKVLISMETYESWKSGGAAPSSETEYQAPEAAAAADYDDYHEDASSDETDTGGKDE